MRHMSAAVEVERASVFDASCNHNYVTANIARVRGGYTARETIELGLMTADTGAPMTIEPVVSASETKTKHWGMISQRKPVQLSFSSLSYTVAEGRKKDNKTILKCISGSFSPGHLSGILGPSGAGKSSLMNILAGYRTKSVCGDILVGGKPRDLRKFRKMSCYIMQDDSLLPFLTVNESMLCAANLKLSESEGAGKKSALVNEILTNLSLLETKKTLVKNLSGGQRKRLSIALELINNPPVMFFDEPTSGLDSASCYQCLLLLKTLAQGGRTVICTIHQPSAKLFEMFDHLYLMADGQSIYEGTVSGLVPFLASLGLVCPSYHNPADYVIEISCGEYGDHVPELVVAAKNEQYRLSESVLLKTTSGYSSSTSSSSRWSSSVLENGKKYVLKETAILDEDDDEKKYALPDIARLKETAILDDNDDELLSPAAIGAPGQNSYRSKQSSSEVVSEEDDDVNEHTFATSFFTQFRILFVRTFISIIRDASLTLLRLAAQIFIGSLMGLLYWRIGNESSKAYENAGFLFFGLLFVMFTALMPTVLSFPTEASVFMREHLNYWYSLKAYYFAKTMADLPFQIIFPVIYCSIVYWMTDQPNEFNRVVMFVVLAIMTSLVAQSLGLLIGAAFSLQVAVFLGPVTAIPNLVFSGFFVGFNTMPYYLQWLSYLSFLRYSFEGLLQAMYGYDRDHLHCDPDNPLKCLFYDPSLILRQLDAEKANFYFDIAILGCFFVVLRVMCYFVLRWRVSSER